MSRASEQNHSTSRALGAPLALLLVLALVSMGTGSAAAQQRLVPSTQGQFQYSFAPLVKQAAPAVVNIYTSKVVRTAARRSLFDDPFFRQFFGDALPQMPERTRERVENSLGSGVIIAPEGVIVTNNHVIAGADDIKVVLADRRELTARLLGADQQTDLAVLQVDSGGETLPHLELGDSDALEVGDLVLAIGNPFGVGQTVTNGIVSAVARTGIGITDMNFFIQTDAAINPGNSGGALVGMDGRVIGINTAIYSRTGGSVGIGFAVPANMVRAVVTGLRSGGRVVRPWFGATTQGVTADIAQSLGLRRPIGVLINDLFAKGPAERAGLRVGDVITAVDGREVDDPESLRYRFMTKPLGSRAELSVWRRGRLLSLGLAVEMPPETPPRETSDLTGSHPLVGARVANLSPALADELGVSPSRSGVIILAIAAGSTAERLSFQPGDQILAINGEQVDSVAGLKALLQSDAERWRIRIDREGRQLDLLTYR